MKRILFLCPYPVDHAPSQRFRFEQYLPILREKKYKIKILTFLTQPAWHALYSENGFRKLTRFAKLLIRSLLRSSYAIRSDIIFIHREVIPVGPPFIEWVITKILRKRVIYDFDDAIWLTDNLAESPFVRNLRWRSKVVPICKWSYKVSVGNKYLASFARQHNPNVLINPTTIDTEILHNPNNYPPRIIQEKSVTIGWTGSHSTLKYLEEIEPILIQIERLFSQINFLVIADKRPNLKLRKLKFIKWSKGTEAEDLLKVDIGIMPLLDDEWTRGKCGFKILQYMALEIPPIASPVGVNSEIIRHGYNGYLCSSDKEWISTISDLINNVELRKRIGKSGRQSVIARYSVESNTSNFLSLFE